LRLGRNLLWVLGDHDPRRLRAAILEPPAVRVRWS
jgi:hypothetical protein